MPCIASGSSPRGRGKLCKVGVCHVEPRLIPARAGKTSLPGPSVARSEAHPRAGGENRVVLSAGCLAWGSSPRGRGKRGSSATCSARQRLIPARAGKTGRAPGTASRASAHPRAGGENIAALVAGLVYFGSSPRGRGKPGRHACGTCRCRLIPARAGKTRPGRVP